MPREKTYNSAIEVFMEHIPDYFPGELFWINPKLCAELVVIQISLKSGLQEKLTAENKRLIKKIDRVLKRHQEEQEFNRHMQKHLNLAIT